MSNRKLSKYMTEQKFCYSDTAKAKKIANIFTPTAFNNAVIFCQDFLDPIVDHYARQQNIINIDAKLLLLILSSGQRCIELNKEIGGAPKSQHQFGNAGDINILHVAAKRVFNDIISGRIKQRNGKPLIDIVDQCIYEVDSKGNIWVHLGRAGKPRKQFMRAIIKGSQKTYTNVYKEI